MYPQNFFHYPLPFLMDALLSHGIHLCLLIVFQVFSRSHSPNSCLISFCGLELAVLGCDKDLYIGILVRGEGTTMGFFSFWNEAKKTGFSVNFTKIWEETDFYYVYQFVIVAAACLLGARWDRD